MSMKKTWSIILKVIIAVVIDYLINRYIYE